MCDYCEKEKELGYDDACGCLLIEDKKLTVDIGFDAMMVKINFCPMCGRKMQEGEV